MLATPTMEKLRELRLSGMTIALEEQLTSPETFNEMSFDERIGLMIDREFLARENKRTSSLLKRAKFKQIGACIEDINFKAKRGLNKSSIMSLASCRWVKEKNNIIFTGPTGVGKSYLACALGHRACLEGYSVIYARVAKLLPDLIIAKGDGRYDTIMNRLAKSNILILDDWGGFKLTESNRNDLMEIMEDRYNVHSTIVTSQVPVEKWHEVIGNPTIADAILDRLFSNSYKFKLDGDSLRPPSKNDQGDNEKGLTKIKKKQ